MSDKYVLLEFENTQKRNAYIERAIFPRNAVGYMEYDDSEISKLKELLIQARYLLGIDGNYTVKLDDLDSWEKKYNELMGKANECRDGKYL